MKRFFAPDPAVWTGRTAPPGEYWYQHVNCPQWDDYLTGPGGGVGLLGYAVDEGVRRNQGRTGAAAGPLAIRQQLAKLADHLPEELSLYDLGEITCPDGDLVRSQTALADGVQRLHEKQTLPVLLGGGHDIAYAHYRGTAAAFPDRRIGFINFDAHFDLRPDTDGPTSGTPFYQLAREAYEADADFAYLVLGIQLAASPQSLLAAADDYGVGYKTADELRFERLKPNRRYLDAFLSDLDGFCLTIDLDGFSSAYAPGVSAPSPTGFSPAGVLPLLEYLAASGKMLSLDVAELNPTYDQDNVTARLAARCLERVLYSWAWR